MTVMYLIPDAIFAFMGGHKSAMTDVGRHEADNARGAALAGAGIREAASGKRVVIQDIPKGSGGGGVNEFTS